MSNLKRLFYQTRAVENAILQNTKFDLVVCKLNLAKLVYSSQPTSDITYLVLTLFSIDDHIVTSFASGIS